MEIVAVSKNFCIKSKYGKGILWFGFKLITNINKTIDIILH